MANAPAFDGLGGTLLDVSFVRPSGYERQRMTPITVTGKLTTAQPTTLPTTFTVTGKLTHANPDGYWVDGLHVPGVLAHGTWQITVSDDGFIATTTVELHGGGARKKNDIRREYSVDGPPVGGLHLTFEATPELAANELISATFTGEYLGPADGTVGTTKWTTYIGGPCSP